MQSQSPQAIEKSKKQKANEIELYLKKEKIIFEKLSSEPKILILGSSDCGKSTLLKQMKLSHGDGFSEAEIETSKNAIRQNIFTSVVFILEAKFAQDISSREVFYFNEEICRTIYVCARVFTKNTNSPRDN
jgi:ABC-type polar amino acid transport system ATPase subunit